MSNPLRDPRLSKVLTLLAELIDCEGDVEGTLGVRPGEAGLVVYGRVEGPQAVATFEIAIQE